MKKLFTIYGGSHSLVIDKNGNLNHASGLGLGGVYHSGQKPIRKFEIIAENCDLPAFPNVSGTMRNDTIVRDVKNGQIVFTKRRFLRQVIIVKPETMIKINNKEWSESTIIKALKAYVN